MNETVRSAAQEKLEQVRDKALEYGEQTRDPVKEHAVKLVRAILGIVLGGLAGFGLQTPACRRNIPRRILRVNPDKRH